MAHRTNIAPAPIPIRLVIRAFAWGFGVPFMWVLYLLGWQNRLLQTISKLTMHSVERKAPFKNYVPGTHDVFVCTYAKSGTNWTMQLVHQIAWRGRGTFNHIHDVVPWPDSWQKGFAIELRDESVWRSAPTGLRAIKTHWDWEQLPYSPQARYIYVVRDPKEVVVSGYFFARDGLIGPFVPPIANWVQLALQPYFFGGTTWAHSVASYWAHRSRPNVLILSYKEMKADFPRVARRVADFMGVTLTETELKAVLAQCDFGYMKSIGRKFDVGAAPWVMGKGTMIRKGQAGQSSELLTPAQRERIDTHWKAELQRVGSDFPYDAFCDSTI